ncbi:PolC-type DNA polymerase III [Proteiniclasticum sp. BAD-10]|uniref:DNA polymerase III PolC-type n=1 Tax=Proteiniclasticum sediminis TaxID=2804028 RepID=A0A941CNW0_9CLOT|nr:PolC-type DNA polymerase III [Proteiniclasticum sediminis]MBR0575492.1 PolC-type DNA polymerase III [Proteiniclasticum sediminis]
MELKDLFSQESSLTEFTITQVPKVEFLKKTQNFRVYLTSPRILDPKVKEPLAKFLGKLTGTERDVQVINLIHPFHRDLLPEILQGMFLTDPLKYSFLKDARMSVQDGRLILTHFSPVLIKNFRDAETVKWIQSIFSEYYGQELQVTVEFSEALTPEKPEIDVQSKLKAMRAEAGIPGEISGTSVPVAVPLKKTAAPAGVKTAKVKDEHVLLGKTIKETSLQIRDLDDNAGNCVIDGEVFKMDTRELKTGKTLLILYVTDNTSSIAVKAFLKENEELPIRVGEVFRFKGNVTYDMYSKELTMIVKDIMRMEKVKRQDKAERKRIELHAHTSMSSMDGLVSAKKLMKQAKEFGHPALAITDHGVVQAFPEAMDSAKDTGVKAIYGMEAYIVNDDINIIENIDESLTDLVVFDIETTGFSAAHDRIIEIGAVKVRDGEIIEEFSSFINPQVPIPAKITELTGITDAMVKDAPLVEKVIQDFYAFIQNSTLVAHNAYFDVGFIRKNLADLNMTLNHPIMDTVPMARFLYKELKRHRLDVIAKHLNIDMGSHHRAVDDAVTTVKILHKSMEKMKAMGIETFRELNERSKAEMDLTKLPMFHGTILVQNLTGLKSLYEMVSSSHLESFHQKPRIRKSMLRAKREGLLLGSACISSELVRFILEGRTEEEIRQVASFYDYLEVQPVENNLDLLKDGRIRDLEGLRQLNRRIVELGDELGKPVVATGDVHFLNKEDKIYRQILLSAQGYSTQNGELDLYFRTTEEMLQAFAYLGKEKAEELVITNTHRIADLIGDFLPIPNGTFPPKIEGAEEEIRQMTLDKAHELYGEVLPDVVDKRVQKELNSIISNGYAVLYLIAHKLVAKSLSDGYLVGSRGSVGSSLVATFTGITEVNGLPPHYRCPHCRHSEFFLDGSVSSGADLPEKNCPQCGTLYIHDGHDIPFETFLGFEGDKEPDIDLNFSGEYQAVVHKYTEELFGEGYVFKAGTIGTVADKTAYAYVKKYLEDKEISLPTAEIERLAAGMVGVKRTTGQHPGGIMVVPRDNDVHNFTPVQRPADDQSSDITTTHFDYHSISGRLLKLDILGHDDPTMLRMLQDLTGIDPKTLPLNDPQVLSLFTSTKALGLTPEELGVPVGSYGLPEFGTKFVRGMLLDTTPTSFADLVRISGLSHGTDVWLNNAQYYIKEGFTTLKDCISTRDDIMTYLIYMGLPAKKSFTIMESVRKGKGLKEDDEKVMREFKVPEWYIESCKKIKYMFPKGHAVAYVMMAVRIAYFKVYYPLAYYAAYFSTRATDFDGELILKGEVAVKKKTEELYELGNAASAKEKNMITILEIVYEMYKRGLTFKPIDLYKSHGTKFLIEEGAIRPPLSCLVGVGSNAANSIYDEARRGEFISKEDLRLRSKVSKTVIETLEACGALEGMEETNQLSFFNL